MTIETKRRRLARPYRLLNNPEMRSDADVAKQLCVPVMPSLNSRNLHLADWGSAPPIWPPRAATEDQDIYAVARLHDGFLTSYFYRFFPKNQL